MSTYIIYKTTNLVNDKIYVGQHNTSADDGYLGSGSKLILAVKEFGKQNFVRETIEFCTSANVDEKEVYWIDKLDATNPEIGYNLMKGGCSFPIMFGEQNPMFGKGYLFEGNKNHFFGKKHSEESKIKIANRYYPKGKDHPNFGSKLSEDQKRKFTFKGHKHSNESLEKIRIASTGRKHSKETKDKCKESNLGFKNPNSQFKYILIINDQIEIFESVILLCEKYQFNKDGVNSAIRKNRKYKGFEIKKIPKGETNEK